MLKRKIVCLILFSILCTSHSFAYGLIKTERAFTPAERFVQAIKDGQTDELRTLIEAGFDVNQSVDNSTPLHIAVLSKKMAVIDFLLKAGADVNAEEAATQATPLHLAALQGHTKIAALLIQKGANPNTKMNFDLTPLLIATKFQKVGVLQLLIKSKANLDHSDQEGFTALHFAVQNRDEALTHLLIENGANVNKHAKNNKITPLMLALQSNNHRLIAMLKAHGAQQYP